MPHTPSYLEAAALAADHLDELILESVWDVHDSIARRAWFLFDRTAVGGKAVSHRVHDGIAGLVYTGIGLGLAGASKALRAADRHGLGGDLESTPHGRFVISAVNGLIGDKLLADGSNLGFEMGIRAHGRDLGLDRDSLAAAFPAASDAIVVFVHGLCETEGYWDRASRPRRQGVPSAPSYGARLEAEEGWSPIYVRANTGLPLAESGAALSSLMSRLVEAWPRPVSRIAFVGHSMGGLIVRAACAVDLEEARDWRPKVSDVVTLGTPHLGSAVERGIERGMRLSHRFPELAPYKRIFERRSAGVLGLHDGLPEDVANVPQARYHLVAATLCASPRNPVAHTVGDYLVDYRSAIARSRSGEALFPGASILHVPNADHFDILNHDAVYAGLRTWLAHETRSIA